MRNIMLSISGIAILVSLTVGFLTNFGTMVLLSFSLSALMLLYVFLSPYPKPTKILNISVCIGVMLFVMFAVSLHYYGTNDNVSYDEDAMIILGAAVKGETPSLMLKKRLDVGVAYYHRNPSVVIVVSGGQGPGEGITEALAMERYLMAQGIPKEQIRQEDQATNTCESIHFSKDLLDSQFPQGYQVVIVTNDFHIFRSVMMAQQQGLETTHLHAKTALRYIPINYFRETMAVLLKFVRPC